MSPSLDDAIEQTPPRRASRADSPLKGRDKEGSRDRAMRSVERRGSQRLSKRCELKAIAITPSQNPGSERPAPVAREMRSEMHLFPVIPGRGRKAANPESRSMHRVQFWIPGSLAALASRNDGRGER